MNFLKKVDRIQSVEEAINLQKLGLDLIGIDLNENARFSDDRTINLEKAILIRQALQQAKLVGNFAMNPPFSSILSLVDKIGLDYVQIAKNESLPFKFIKELQTRNVGLIYNNFEASYDDDVSWILSDLQHKSNLNVSFFQIELLADIENAWDFFKKETPKYPEELQINDIINIAKQYPIIITLDYSVDNIIDILATLPSIRGINMTLADGSNRNDMHFSTYKSVESILKKFSPSKKNI